MRSAFAALLVCLSLAGCYGYPQYGDPIPAERVRAALDGWRAMGHPITMHCVSDADSLTVLVTNEDELKSICNDINWPPSHRAMGCRSHTNILIAESLDPEAAEDTIEHELRHWMSWCTYSDGDNQHRDPRIWYHYRGHSIL